VCLVLAWLVAIVVSVGSLAVGTILIVNGQPDLELAIILDTPHDDFIHMGQICNITRINHCWRTSGGNGSGTPPLCTSIYTPRFTAPTYSGYKHWSAYPEEVPDGEHDCGSGCNVDDVMTMPSGAFESGKYYDCWRPSGSSFDRRYECGNDHCVKIRDPSLISEHYKSRAKTYYYWGGGLMLAALLSCCCCVVLTTRVENNLFEPTPTVSVISRTSKVDPAAKSDGPAKQAAEKV